MVSEDEGRSGSIPAVQTTQETTDEEIQKWVASERETTRETQQEDPVIRQHDAEMDAVDSGQDTRSDWLQVDHESY